MAKTRTAWVCSRSSTSMPCSGSAWTPRASRFRSFDVGETTRGAEDLRGGTSARSPVSAVLVDADFLVAPRLHLLDRPRARLMVIPSPVSMQATCPETSGSSRGSTRS